MFGMGMWEIAVIAIVALLVVGPDKLPDAAKKLSQGIRDFRRSTRELSKNIEEDTDIGSAVRDLKSALRGDDLRPAYQPPHLRKHTAKPPEGADGTPGKEIAEGDPLSPAPAPEPAADDAIAELAGEPDLPVLTTPSDSVAQSDADDTPDDPPPAEAGKAHG